MHVRIEAPSDKTVLKAIAPDNVDRTHSQGAAPTYAPGRAATTKTVKYDPPVESILPTVIARTNKNVL
ncbi:MAG: hypothetical protein WCT04_07385 [Planctomycetota bacterium]